MATAYSKSVLVGMALVLCSLSPSLSFGQAKASYYYAADLPFKLETGYRKTTGISGKLFGHLSQGDVDQLLRGGQKALVQHLQQRGIDPKKVQLLPVQVVEAKDSVAGTVQGTREKLFGGTRTDSFSNFEMSGKIRIAFVHSERLDVRDFARQRITKAEVSAHGARGKHLGAIAVKPASLSLGLAAKDLKNEYEPATLKLNKVVPSKERFRLGDAVRKLAGESFKSQVKAHKADGQAMARLTLKSGEVVNIKLHSGTTFSGDSAMFKTLKVGGASRWLSPKHLRYRLGKALRRLRPALRR